MQLMAHTAAKNAHNKGKIVDDDGDGGGSSTATILDEMSTQLKMSTK